MLKLVKDYIKPLMSKSVMSRVNSYSANYVLKFLAKQYTNCNLHKYRILPVQNFVQRSKISGGGNVCESHSCHCKTVLRFFGIPKILSKNMAPSACDISQSSQRSYSTTSDQVTEVEYKFLMDSPMIVWPSWKNAIPVFLKARFIVKPFYDREFSYSEFHLESARFVAKISTFLSQGNFNAMRDYVDGNALEEISKNFSCLSEKERLDLAVSLDDIIFHFPHKLQLLFKNKGQENERVFLEITMCYHVFQGFQEHKEYRSKNPDPRFFYNQNDFCFKNYNKYYFCVDERISVSNYRFIKEITKGSNGEWLIDVINHVNPVKFFYNSFSKLKAKS